jgi:hypothetical protein
MTDPRAVRATARGDRRAAAGVLLATFAGVARAHADPVIELDRCGVLDRPSLRAAIDGELAVTPPAARLEDATLTVECPSEATARISVEARARSVRLARELTLDEVAPDLRVKLVAVALVELVEVAATQHDQLPSPPASGPSSHMVVSTQRAIASARGAPPTTSAVAIVSHAGVRTFASRPIALAYTGLDVELRWLALGVAGSIGSASDPLGALTPYLATATASTAPACVGAQERICVRAHGELGVAGARAHAANSLVAASNALGPYAQLGVGSAVEHSFQSSFGVVLGVDAAVAKGLVVASQERTPVRLDGLVFTATLGLRWRP